MQNDGARKFLASYRGLRGLSLFVSNSLLPENGHSMKLSETAVVLRIMPLKFRLNRAEIQINVPNKTLKIAFLGRNGVKRSRSAEPGIN